MVEFMHKLGIRHLAIYRDLDGRFANTDAASTAAAALYGAPVTYLVAPSERIAGDIAGTVDWLAGDA